MASYDLFSGFYDRSLERLYRDARASALGALAVEPGHRVLDVPCGTGQSHEGLAAAAGPTGAVVGVDLSAGMLRQAMRRVTQSGWQTVHLHRADAESLPEDIAPDASFDRLHVFLGMTVFPRPDETFDRLWRALRPGGRCVIVDVHAERLGLQGALVNWTAGADIRRRSWEPLERLARDFTRAPLPSRWQHGGTLYLAAGDKPR